MHVVALTLLWLPMVFSAQDDEALPIIEVDRDNVTVDQSCVIYITKEVIRDTDDNGIIHIDADDITVLFTDDREHRELRGSPNDTPWDQCEGIGVRVDGHDNVTIRGAHCHRFKVGIYASNADGLTVQDCDVGDGYAQRLRSTPNAEDSSDWLRPHDNFNNEWMHHYGAGLYVKQSDNVVIRDCSARRRQNGIIIDNVNNSKIYDNDCSFLSGWGLAMWKSNDNVITRNAFDFCVRGFSHGVYNRGQDSAGILMFEQCSNNTIAENSATHGGDGFFGFAGTQALGQTNPRDDLAWYERRGCNDNLLIGNDFSYAAAHGIEMTFSFGNELYDNRLVENAICGVWGGYSQQTLMAGNTFERNGDMPYGLERGGINIEHGAGNQIKSNHFKDNACGVHVWWDNDVSTFDLPWYRANTNKNASAAAIFGNTFDGDDIALQFRHLKRRVMIAANRFSDVDNQRAIAGRVNVEQAEVLTTNYKTPTYPVFGERDPVAARQHLRGRDKIIMTKWFPYDWKSPHVQWSRQLDDEGKAWLEARLLGFSSTDHEVISSNRRGIRSRRTISTDSIASGHAARASFGPMTRIEKSNDSGNIIHRLTSSQTGPIRMIIKWSDDEATVQQASRTMFLMDWKVRHFQSPVDPREDVETWRNAAHRAPVVQRIPSLDERWATDGPEGLDPDHFGTVATTSLEFPAGRWRINTTSDDGIRVWLNDELVIDDWTWHAPKEHTHEFELKRPKTVDLRVEHFELDGYAMLKLDVEAVGRP